MKISWPFIWNEYRYRFYKMDLWSMNLDSDIPKVTLMISEGNNQSSFGSFIFTFFPLVFLINFFQIICKILIYWILNLGYSATILSTFKSIWSLITTLLGKWMFLLVVFNLECKIEFIHLEIINSISVMKYFQRAATYLTSLSHIFSCYNLKKKLCRWYISHCMKLR